MNQSIIKKLCWEKKWKHDNDFIKNFVFFVESNKTEHTPDEVENGISFWSSKGVFIENGFRANNDWES